MEVVEQDCILDTTEKIVYPPIALSIGEKSFTTKDGVKSYPVPIGTYGNFSFVQAPPKTKKTFFVSLLASVYLAGNNKFGGDIKGHRGDRKLLHFDTEQGKWHCQKVFRRVLDMNNTKQDDNYQTFTLRTIGYKTRLEFIEYWLRERVEEGKAGIDPNRKGMDISQSFGSSSSYARKYALNGLLLIDDTKDADVTNTHNKEKSFSTKAKDFNLL